MAIQVGFPQTSQDLTALHASAFPPSQIQPQHCFNVTHTHPDMLQMYINLHVSAPTSTTPSLPSLEKHNHEIDRYIRLQGEKLSMELQEQGKQQVATVLKAVELNMLNSMRQKDEEIAWAVQKRMELEDLLNRVEAENQAWRRAALESEAMMLSLSNSLEMMKGKAHCSSTSNNVRTDEAQSCWDENARDDEQIEREMAACTCKSCKSGRSCFLLLPCRHLCACKDCEPFLQACPVCAMPKKASIEAFVF